jgi:hypothetical protein
VIAEFIKVRFANLSELETVAMNSAFTSLLQEARAGALVLTIAATALCSIITSTLGQGVLNSTSTKTTSQLETSQTNTQ